MSILRQEFTTRDARQYNTQLVFRYGIAKDLQGWQLTPQFSEDLVT